MDILYCHLGFGAGNTLASINDVSSTAQTLATPNGSRGVPHELFLGAPVGGVTTMVGDGGGTGTPMLGDLFGIVIGTGNTAVTASDDKLSTKILHGEGAGTLLFGGVEFYGLTFTNPNGSFNIRRYFTNVAGGSITVQESGLYARGHAISTNPFCVCRDVFAGVTVANGQILSVVYTIQITV